MVDPVPEEAPGFVGKVEPAEVEFLVFELLQAPNARATAPATATKWDQFVSPALGRLLRFTFGIPFVSRVVWNNARAFLPGALREPS